jgi:hypothetical protein
MFNHAIACAVESLVSAGFIDKQKSSEAEAHMREFWKNKLVDIWSVEDVQSVRPDLDEKQAVMVLEHLDRNFDSEIGINWQRIEQAAIYVFGPLELDSCRLTSLLAEELVDGRAD